MYVNFYLLKNVYFPDNLPGSFSTICLYSCAPLGLYHIFKNQKWSCEDVWKFKVSFAHWVIFRIWEGHCLHCTMDTCHEQIEVNLIGLDTKIPQYSEKCKCTNGLVYFWVLFSYFSFLKCTMEVWNKCRGSNQITIIF